MIWLREKGLKLFEKGRKEEEEEEEEIQGHHPKEEILLHPLIVIQVLDSDQELLQGQMLEQVEVSSLDLKMILPTIKRFPKKGIEKGKFQETDRFGLESILPLMIQDLVFCITNLDTLNYLF